MPSWAFAVTLKLIALKRQLNALARTELDLKFLEMFSTDALITAYCFGVAPLGLLRLFNALK